MHLLQVVPLLPLCVVFGVQTPSCAIHASSLLLAALVCRRCRPTEPGVEFAPPHIETERICGSSNKMKLREDRTRGGGERR
jgi:hypothetical protein